MPVAYPWPPPLRAVALHSLWHSVPLSPPTRPCRSPSALPGYGRGVMRKPSNCPVPYRHSSSVFTRIFTSPPLRSEASGPDSTPAQAGRVRISAYRAAGNAASLTTAGPLPTHTGFNPWLPGHAAAGIRTPSLRPRRGGHNGKERTSYPSGRSHRSRRLQVPSFRCAPIHFMRMSAADFLSIPLPTCLYHRSAAVPQDSRSTLALSDHLI